MARDPGEEPREGMKWWVGLVECMICEHVQTSAIEIPEELDEPWEPMECEECESLACRPTYD